VTMCGVRSDRRRASGVAAAAACGENGVVPGAAVGYFSTLPLAAIVDALQAASIPAAISNTAGTYLCNRVFYQVMHHGAVHRLAQRAGFVHLPHLHEQAIGKPLATPSLALATLVDAVRIVLQQACTD